MAKTKIEWCNYTINPVKGLCPVGCEYCYARRMYQRFGWDPRIRYEAWSDSLAHISQPSLIFVGSTMELFGDWIYPQWLEAIFSIARSNPCHTFIFLTKQPQNLAKWSPFPENCWVGVTVTRASDVLRAVNCLYNHAIAKTQFLSIEPLLSWDTRSWRHPLPSHISKKDLDWIIIGQQTPVRKATMPKVEWIVEIVQAADQAGIPVFEKDNLKPALQLNDPLMAQAALDLGLLNWEGELRQEFPE